MAFEFEIVTLAPLEGAALLSVTVQVLDAFGPSDEGLQESDETATGAIKSRVAWAEVPLYVAFKVAF